MTIGTNIQVLKQAFNLKHGLDPKASRAPDRILGQPPQTKGANKGRTVDIDTLMADYWELFGWDKETGCPPQEMIHRVTSIA